MQTENIHINQQTQHPVILWAPCAVWSGHVQSEVKNLFHVNSAEHEISSANKYENANNSWHFHIY